MFLFLLVLDDFERSKLHELYEMYKDDMYRKAYYMLKNHDLSQDAMQMAIIKITKHMGKIDKVNSIKTKAYIMTIVKNIALDMIKGKSYQDKKKVDDIQEARLNTLHDKDLIAEDWMVNREKADELNKCISKLNESYAEIIYLRYYQELGIKEISDVLGISSNSVSVKINRAISALRSEVTNNEYFRRENHVG